MARPLRIEFQGALYHVMARGNARADIFLDDEDRQAFVDNLGRVCGRFEWRVWAWCLMSNHYHLLIETLEPTLSRGMREVNGVHTQAFNRRHRRSGHVLQGRFKAPLVDKDHYLLELSRYVVLNPVRARMVESAADWSWSSYLAIMGRAKAQDWLAVEDTLALFHEQRGPARRAYARFVAEGIGAPDPWEDCPRAGFVGDQGFVDRMLERVDLSDLSPEITRKSRPAPSLRSIEEGSQDRNDAIRTAYATTAYSLTDIARHFGVHVSTASRIARGMYAKGKT
ncbi:MAG: transposase [Pseudomonadota bacterium]